MDDNNCINNECSKCGKCCTPFLPMSKNEVKNIERFLKQNPEIIKKALENNPIQDNKVIIRCCFFKDNNCMIYPVRPFICRAYKCNQSSEIMEKNKKTATNKATYNTLDIKTMNDFRNLFFGDATLIISGIMYFLKIRDIEELEKFVEGIGRKDLIEYVNKLKEKEYGKGKL